MKTPNHLYIAIFIIIDAIIFVLRFLLLIFMNVLIIIILKIILIIKIIAISIIIMMHHAYDNFDARLTQLARSVTDSAAATALLGFLHIHTYHHRLHQHHTSPLNHCHYHHHHQHLIATSSPSLTEHQAATASSLFDFSLVDDSFCWQHHQ